MSLALLSRLGAADWRRSGTTDSLRTPVLDDIPLPAFEAEPLPLSRFAEPEQPAPDTSSRRLVIHHRADDMSRARALLAPLRARGFEPELRQVPHAIARSHIRYFYSDDLEGARLVSGIVSGHGGEATALRDFVHHRPSPRPGTLELWLSN